MKYLLWKYRVLLRQSHLAMWLLDYAHKPNNISTWKHDFIERIIYGKNN